MSLLIVAVVSSVGGSSAQTCVPLPEPVISDALRPYVSVAEPRVVLRNATVHVGDGAAPLLNQSILIQGDTILRVGDSAAVVAPVGTREIDLAGHTVMPGIVGMHNHLHMPGIPLMAYSAPRLYLAGGVTTIQTTGSADPLGELRLARAIDKGDVPGPHVFPTAPYVTGPGGNAAMEKPESAKAARAFVQQWAARGATGFKLYRHVTPEIAAAVIDEAHRHRLKVTGHLCSLSFREAALLGIDRIEHGLNAATDFDRDKPAGECLPSRESKRDLDVDGPEVSQLIELLIAQDVTLTSTLAILESGFPHRPQAQDRALKAMSPDLLDAYHLRQIELQESAATTSSTPEYWALITQFERRFVEAGGHLVAGADTGRHVLPGFGDQRNFELLVESGFSAAETVKIMTHNGATALGIGDRVGLVEEGYRADLIVVRGDLDADPSTIRAPTVVFKGGIGFDPGVLIADVEGQVGIR